MSNDSFDNANEAPSSRFGFSPTIVGAHTLSEWVFCPRAGVLAHGGEVDRGSEEPDLGQKLDWYGDLEEHQLVEQLRLAWGEFRYWLVRLLPAVTLALLAALFTGRAWGIGIGLPMTAAMLLAAGHFARRCRKSLNLIYRLWREIALARSAPPIELELCPERVLEVNWWSLRKAGFECRSSGGAYQNLSEGLTGKPWRILVKGTTLRIPVIRKHRGERSWGRQHVVRIAAYCHLIETGEGADSPFGVLMFPGSYDCVIIPNNHRARLELHQSLADARELLELQAQRKVIPAGPTDNRCAGCHWGLPRLKAARSQTVHHGIEFPSKGAVAVDGRKYHSSCCDVFGEIPPHARAVALEIAEERS